MALIEQEALLRRLRSHYNRVEGGGTIYTPSMMLAITDVERAPVVAAVPVVHGRWVKANDDTCWWYECSRCGRRPSHDLYGYDDLTGYCPHCGARMDGGNDDG